MVATLFFYIRIEDKGMEVSTEDQEPSLEEQEPEIVTLKRALEEKERTLLLQQQQIAELRAERFGVNRFGTDDKMFNFYTGFSSIASFKTFYEFCAPSASNMQSAYYVTSDTSSLAGRPRGMLLIDELFMFLCRLRVNLFENDLALRFNCHISTVSRKLITWVNYLYMVLGSIPIWLPKSEIQRLMPPMFKTLAYPIPSTAQAYSTRATSTRLRSSQNSSRTRIPREASAR